MIDLRVGVKIYDCDWLVRNRLDTEHAADLLASMGVTYVITQSRFLPMQDTAVESAVRLDSLSRDPEHDDIALREALRERGIGYLGCLNICFDPAFSEKHPELLPIDHHGRRAAQEDWYIGMPPDREANLQHKSALLEKAVRALQPDGIHLGFIRWPGFWETWLRDIPRSAHPEYCFAPETLAHFRADTGIAVPSKDPVKAARLIAAEHRNAWRDWKCGVTVSAIARLRGAIEAVRPGTEIAINTLPFFRTDFDDAVTEVFGQDVSRLSAVVDIFEVMAYHQILGRKADWPAAISADIKGRGGSSKAICTLQAKAMYLDGMHAGKGRATDISAEEFTDALSGLENGPADGVCVFTLTQLLEMRETAKGRAIVEALKAFRQL
jgi:hypothetical protein